MKKLLMLFSLWLTLVSGAFAGTTAVTATITGQDGFVWANGSYSIEFRPAPSNPTPVSGYTVNGASFTKTFSGNLDGTGSFSQTLTDNLTVSPANSMWTFTICPNASFQCFAVNVVISGASMSLSTTLSNATPSIKVSAPPIPRAYDSSQIVTPPQYSAMYFDTTQNLLKFWNGSSWTTPSIGTSFNLLSGGTNSTAAMICTTGCSISASASGSIHATIADNATNATNATNASAIPWSGVTSTPTSLAGYGITDPIAKVVVSISNTGLTANVGVTTFYTTTVAGMYRMSCYLVITVRATTSSTLPNCQASFTDKDTNQVSSLTSINPTVANNVLGTNTTNTNNPGTGSGTIVFNAAASTVIQYATSGYTSSPAGMTYNIHIILEYLGQ